ncbi:MAG: hypothetical protein JWP87_4957 [Labilithrix sp.]|nr:hypothetical protein [Labilithrix sp.]
MHALGCALVLALGFDHVSDDDFARVTIAQSFAHSPKLDPSGTSWLPFPFWALGSVMSLAGRSLAVARGVSIVLASLASTLPYVAMRTTGATRRAALLATAFAMLSPWSLWLGAATVPESFTASFTAAAAIALGCGKSDAGADDARRLACIGFAIALLCACLSRYEPWPVAAVLAIVLAIRAARARDVRPAVLAAIVAAGPLAWIAWNAHAHGDAFHFFARVARFKRALGEGSPSAASALLLYPRLFVMRRPDVVVALACAFVAGHVFVPLRADVRRRWSVALACAAAQIAFLAYGNAHDGAPAHHAERALLGVVFLTAAFAADVLDLAAARAIARARGAAFAAAGVVVLAWLATIASARGAVPGNSPAEDRAAQLQAGAALAKERVEHIDVTPCAYEHFALIAAYGAPERASVNPRAGAEITSSCPAVERR